MLKGGVIMDVVTADQAKIAEDAGAVAVMALERVPADIRREGGVARMSDPGLIQAIIEAVTIPVMAKCRIGHFVEAQILEAIGVDYIDESEVLTPADEEHHINKHSFKIPFVCGCRDLGEALRRIAEGAAMIRTKGEAGTGNVVEAVRRQRAVTSAIRRVDGMGPEAQVVDGKELGEGDARAGDRRHSQGGAARGQRLVSARRRIGVLALQGDFREHLAALRACEVEGVAVRTTEELDRVDALILPGGESTTMSRLMDSKLRQRIQERAAAGMPVMGTCAGMILMASEVLDGTVEQEPLKLMHLAVRRNAYGRQRDSFEAEVDAPALGGPGPGVFIRAPQV